MDKRSASELKITLSAAVAFGALLAAFGVFRPVRDALILGGNPEKIPWIWLGTFVVISIVSPVWSAVLARWSRRRVVPFAYHVAAACAVAFFVIYREGWASVAVGRAFYIWSAVFNLFVVSVLWSLLADLLGPSTARRLYGPIAAGGTIGTVVGPILTRLLVRPVGVGGVLLVSALLLELAVLGIARVRHASAALDRDDASSAESDPDAPSGGGAFTGIAYVARSPYLSMIVGYVLCTAFAASFLYLRQAAIVKEAISDVVSQTDYFATIDIWVNVAAFVLQTVIVRPLLGWFGPGVVLVMLPLAQLAGISTLAIAPSLAALAIVQVIGRSATHGLTRPARELLFTVVSRDEKYRAKHAIDTIGYRFGDVAAGWLNNALVAIGGAVAVAVAAIPLTAIWLVLAAFLGVGFRRRATSEKP